MILGLDIGNFNVKTSENICFQSRIQDNKFGDLFHNNIVFNEKDYTLGNGNFEIEGIKYERDSFLPLLLAAIGISTEETCNKIVIGLPANQWKDENIRKGLVDLLKDQKYQFTLNTDSLKNVTRDIIIEDVHVFPEGLGAFLSMDQKTISKYQTRDSVIIDIGGRTTDICIVKAGTKINIENINTINEGMFNVFSILCDEINTSLAKYNIRYNMEDMHNILENGIKLQDKNFDITESIQKAFVPYIKRLYDVLRVNYNIDISNVIITGGGSYHIARTLQSKIPHLHVIDDFLFANAIGYKKVGEEIWL